MLSALDYYHLLNELKDLNGSRLSKIYQDDENRDIFLFEFHVPQKGTVWVQIIVPQALFIVDEKITPQSPPGFCQFLRKKIQGMILNSVTMTGFERIIKMEFKVQQEIKHILYLEMFAKGNVILTDTENKIIGVWKTIEYNSRNLRGGAVYELPPAKKNPQEITLQELNQLLADSKVEIVKFCANTLGLGGPYSEYILNKAKIDKKLIKITESQAKKMFEIIKSLFDESVKNDLLKISFEKTGTYNEILKENFQGNLFLQKKKASKKESIFKAQNEQMKQFEIDAKINQEKGELIYQNYEKVKILMENAKKERKRKITVEL